MYEVYCNSRLIYNDDVDELKIFNAKIEKELGKSGSFEFTVYPDNPVYEEVVPLLGMVSVYQNNESIYSGRVLNISYGFYNEKQVTCEGELAFLLDTVIYPHVYNGSFSGYLDYVLEQHNIRVESTKQFQRGRVTVGDFSPFMVVENLEYKSAYDTLMTRMVERSGGYLEVRNEGGVRYLDLLSYEADGNASTQNITLGKNLVDLTRETHSEDVFSCIVPQGAKMEGTEIRIDIKPVNNGVPYIVNEEAAAIYGRIYKAVVFDEITQESTLLTTAREYLAQNYAGSSTVEIKAVDLSTVDSDMESFRVGQWVRVFDAKHFSNDGQTFLIRKMTIDIHNPANTKITIGKTSEGLTDAVASSAAVTSDAQQPYLMEKGSTGIWTWKKFSDGTCEFFGKIGVLSAEVNSAFGAWYRGVNLYEATAYEYPFQMTEAPALEMTFQTRNGLGAMLWIYSQDAETAQRYVPQCYLIRPTTATGIHGNINIIGKGKL